MAQCPTEDVFASFVEGTLDSPSREALVDHASGCAACASLVAALAVTMPGVSSGPPSDDASPETRVGRYEILRTVGAGGMSVVYEALDPELQRKVAIKVLRPLGGSVRLEREAQAMARLMHPNVAVVHDVGRVGGQVFLAMELVTGGTLATWLAAARRDPREVLRKFLLAGRGLAAAHAAGIVHRDFKPENVLVGEGDLVRVADFGLAASLEQLAADARDGRVEGTPIYMAPEQIDDEAVDARADVFSFSAALWSALYGVRPFEGRTVHELREAILAGRLRHGATPRGLPEAIAKVLARGLAARPDDRWPSMGALLDALEAASRPRRTWRWAIAGVAAAAAIAVVPLAERTRARASMAPHGPVLVLAFDARSAPDGSAMLVEEATRATLASSVSAPVVRLERAERLRADCDAKDAAGALACAEAYAAADRVVALTLGDGGVDAVLYDGALRTPLGREHAVVTSGDWAGAARTIAIATARDLGAEGDVATLAARASLPQGAADARDYARALDARARLDWRTERELLGAIAARAPDPIVLDALRDVLLRTGRRAEAARHAARAAELARALPPRTKALLEARAAALADDPAAGEEKLRALWSESPDDVDLALELAELQQLREGKRALETLRAATAGSRVAAADPRIELAEAELMFMRLEDVPACVTLDTAAVAKAKASGFRLTLARARVSLAVCLAFARRVTEAEATAELVLPSLHELGDVQDESRLVAQLGMDAALRGDLPAARAKLEEALALAEQGDDLARQTVALARLAIVFRRQYDLAHALEVNARSIAIAREVQDKDDLAGCLNNRSAILQGLGDIDGTEAAAREAIAIASGTHSQRVPIARSNLAFARAWRGDLEGAEAAARSAVAMATENDELAWEMRHDLAVVLIFARRFADAEPLLASAADEAHAARDVGYEASARAELALALAAQGKREAARAALAAADEALAHESSREVFWEVKLAAARARLLIDPASAPAVRKELDALSKAPDLAAAYPVALELRLVRAMAARNRAELRAVEEEAKGRGFVIFADQARAVREG